MSVSNENFRMHLVKIEDHPNYSVSKNGEVYSHKRNKFMKQWNRGKGYLAVEIDKKTYSVHRLVAVAFIPNPNPYKKKEVNHIDGNKHNNKASNLEWSTHQQNMKHAGEKHLMRKGVNHSSSTLNDLQVRIIRRSAQMGLTHKLIASIFEVNKATVTRIVNRQSWKHI